MELSLSGNALKTFARCITCLARIGNELAIQASPSQLAFHTLNSSRSAYQSITFKPDFFDVFTISGTQVQCSVLLKAISAVLRTPLTSIDHLSVLLPDPDASKVQWTLDCYNGMRKAYWITCNIEPDIQHLSLDRRKFPSSFVVRPRDLNRLLGNFQSTLQEITIIATEPSSLPSDAASEIGGKAVELRSYIDPTKENDSSLHTQLWIDPAEEFVQYAHVGDPVDVTFGVKELKAFLSFCEGCEVDVHLYFEKAGEPILMAPKLGVDDGSTSNFDATLVLATMLISQLHEGNPMEPPAAAAMRHDQPFHGTGSQAQERTRGNVSEYPSDHTRIWSDISGSGAKSGNGVEERHVEGGRNPTTKELGEIQRMSTMHISEGRSDVRNMARGPNPNCHPMETDRAREPQERADMEGHGLSQHHPSNWVDADEDDDEGDEAELCVQSTPPYHEE
ncbi:Cell cycle checkpoint control protein like [Actinidia chinensis var. chinensis]|uniref:Cell cycle checkpoint control protein like n=1 Tax=Actinidia chinensis var. chinensis TaxID=1590841 RepID=A0A2R6RD75_ACTCC|nr:Cell cycle checkpoint control protein like [Actinidia chinensis var. chinensis]